MRKGDEKRESILVTAERMFCSRGYEATSIQDILDELHASKGGFYHYFVSKDAVLDALCARRVEQSLADAQEEIALLIDPVARVNRLLSDMMPLKASGQAFFSMLMPILNKPEGKTVRVRYQEALAQAFEETLREEIAQGIRQGTFYSFGVEMAAPVLVLANQCWAEVIDAILMSRTQKKPVEPAQLNELLSKYRKSIELLLDAPYGSMILMELEELTAICSSLRQ